MELKPGLEINSAVFNKGEKIPPKYTCDGENISPPLVWSNSAEGAESWMVIMDDPDAPRSPFIHWIIYNIPVEQTGLPEAVPNVTKLPGGALQSRNDTLTTGYSGPCPPPGPSHHYNFTLYALDKILDLPSEASKKQIFEAIQDHIISQGKLTGIYSR